MSKKTKDFNLQEFLDKQRIRKLFKKATVFLVLAVLIGGFVGVWSTGVIQKAIYNSQDLPDYVSYVDHTHSYTKTVVEPTCTEQGYTLYECRYCDMSYKQDYTATIDHDYQEVVLEQATTTSYGKAELVCSMCGDVKYEITLPLIGHTFTSEVVEPTCTEDGYTIHRSTDTDDVYIDEVIPATGHSMKLKDNYFYCETCGVVEYIEDCAAYGCSVLLVTYDNETYSSREYWYADSAGVLYLAGDQYGRSGTGFLDNDPNLMDYTKVVFLDTVTTPELSNLPDTVTEVTLYGNGTGLVLGSTWAYEGLMFPSGVETVVLDADYDVLYIEGLGIKSLTISGNIEYLTGLVCPSLEKLDLGEGIANIGMPDDDSEVIDVAIVNFGNVETVVFPHSTKSIAISVTTESSEYLDAQGSDEFSYGFDWYVYLPNMTDCVLKEHYLPITPEEYLAWAERRDARSDLSSLEEYLGFSYEEYVVAYEAYTVYLAELEGTNGSTLVLVVQEGTTNVKLVADYVVDGEFYIENIVLFLPATLATYTDNIEAYENVQFYYAGSQTDALTVLGSSWIKYVVAYNVAYSGQ